jgi:hypothetical protein
VGGNKDRTYLFWARVPNAAESCYLLPTGDFRFWWRGDSSYWRCQNTSGSNYFDDTNSDPDNNWRHFAVVVDTGGTHVYYYWNGNKDPTEYNGAAINTTDHNANGIGYGNLVFYLDDFAILDEALSASRIKLVYNAGNNADLAYDLGRVWTVFEGYDAQNTVKVDNRLWAYVDDLSGTAGTLQDDGVDSEGNHQFTMYLTNTTGMQSRAVPTGTVFRIR